MTTKEFALMLNERAIGDELSHDEEQYAKDSGLVVVFGVSDDLMELRGAIHDEVGCYNGGTACLDTEGVFFADCENADCKLLHRHLRQCKTIEALWADGSGFSWTYATDIPHETFVVMEDGMPYCRGFVFNLAALSEGDSPTMSAWWEAVDEDTIQCSHCKKKWWIPRWKEVCRGATFCRDCGTRMSEAKEPQIQGYC